jgi:hypothetical protein
LHVRGSSPEKNKATAPPGHIPDRKRKEEYENKVTSYVLVFYQEEKRSTYRAVRIFTGKSSAV